MPDWREYIRENLPLRGLRPDREAEIVEDLAQQLEDAYRDAVAGGMAEADALETARQHIPDWAALSRELHRSQYGAAPALERLQEGAGIRARSGGFWAFAAALF